MPRSGFTSITVSQFVYDSLYEKYLAKKADIGRFYSFSEFVEDVLADAHKQKEKLKKIASRVERIPLIVRMYT